MWRRWIIRGLFVGLLVVCAGAWVRSQRHFDGVFGTWGKNAMNVRSGSGKLCVSVGRWLEPRDQPSLEKLTQDIEWGHPIKLYGESRDVLGFAGGTWRVEDEGDFWFFGQPYWFLTAVIAGLVLLVWRKTGKAKAGRGFPVEPCVKPTSLRT